MGATTRVVLRGGALAGLVVLTQAGAAYAQEHEEDLGGEEVGPGDEETGAEEGGHIEGLTHENECYAEAVHDNETDGEALNDAIEACKEAPNPLLPETNEIVWGALGFLVVFVFIAKFGFPAIKKGLDARTERIRNSLDEAERTRTEAQTILDDYQRQLADARNEAGRIIEEARQAAESMRRDLIARAEADAAQTRERATADIQAQVERATADLRQQVAALSVEAAELVVGRALQDRNQQLALVEDFIARVGSHGTS